MLLKYYERYQNLTISSWLRVDNFVYGCIGCFIAADVLMSNTRTSAAKKKKKKNPDSIVTVLYWCCTKQNKTKLKNKKKKKKKNKKSIFQTIEVLNDLSKSKSDFLYFNIFLCKKQKQKNCTFSACFINMVLQYLRQLHNFSSFFIISHKPSDLYRT